MYKLVLKHQHYKDIRIARSEHIYLVGGEIYKVKNNKELPSDYINQGYLPLLIHKDFATTVNAYYENNSPMLTRIVTVWGDDKISIYKRNNFGNSKVFSYEIENGKLYIINDLKRKREKCINNDFKNLCESVVKKLEIFTKKYKDNIYNEEIKLIKNFVGLK